VRDRQGSFSLLWFVHLAMDDARAYDKYALRYAAKYGHLEIVKYLCEHFHLTIDDARVKDNYALREAAENACLKSAHLSANCTFLGTF
jgi:hypothetical protein